VRTTHAKGERKIKHLPNKVGKTHLWSGKSSKIFENSKYDIDYEDNMIFCLMHVRLMQIHQPYKFA